MSDRHKLESRIAELKDFNKKKQERIENLESENARLRKALEYHVFYFKPCKSCYERAKSALEGEKENGR